MNIAKIQYLRICPVRMIKPYKRTRSTLYLLKLTEHPFVIKLYNVHFSCRKTYCIITQFKGGHNNGSLSVEKTDII